MSTYGEVTYMVLDEIKLLSDDSIIQQEHVIFLLDKYRSFLIKRTYEQQQKEMPDSNLQTICLHMERKSAFDNDSCDNQVYLVSKERIPEVLSGTTPKITTSDYFSGNISYTSRERFQYTGGTQFTKNMIYATISPNKYLYMKSDNPQAYYLNEVKFTGVFEDASKAAELSCDGTSDSECDILDKNYPLEEALIPEVISLVVKELLGAAYRPQDKTNDASDDLADLARFIRLNIKPELAKKLAGDA